MFGRPRGLLGRIGGRLLATRGKRKMAECVLSELDVEPTDHVIEIGFGPGIGIQSAAARTPDGFVAGVDYSEVMVELALNQNAEDVEAGNVELRFGSVDDLPYEDGTFDLAFSINSMQVWPNPIEGLEEIRRVLKPSGRVVLGFTPSAGQSSDELQPLLSDGGFDNIRIEEKEMGICAIASK